LIQNNGDCAAISMFCWPEPMMGENMIAHLSKRHEFSRLTRVRVGSGELPGDAENGCNRLLGAAG
jgi:hypothetical protein